MLKRIALLTRKPGMTREEFLKHWNEVHGPLIARSPHVLRYLQNNILTHERFVDRNPDPADPLPPGYNGPPVDGVVELWFEDRAAMEALYASPLAKEMYEDGLLHLGTITTFTVEERTVVDRTAPATGALGGEFALVTGAGRGIGAALARGIARAGARVLVTDMDAAAAEATAGAIVAAGGAAEHAVLDVTDAAACQALARNAAERHGGLSLLVNNAGVTLRRTMDDADVAEAWRRTWDVNAQGVFNVTHAMLPMISARQGAILNISSVAAVSGRSLNTAYESSKAAVSQMTRGWAVELAPRGVRVNALAPGIVATELSAHTRADPEKTARTLSRVPMGRVAQPEELVAPAVFLLSRAATYVTGAVLPVDGGFLAT
jgi:uncharacterized protein (TIGR02118 family)